MSKPIYLNILIRKWITFTKIIGIFPVIHTAFYKEMSRESYYNSFSKYDFFRKNSYARWISQGLRYYNSFLNDALIDRIFMFGEFNTCSKIAKEKQEIIDLFFSYLKEFGYYRYCKIII